MPFLTFSYEFFDFLEVVSVCASIFQVVFFVWLRRTIIYYLRIISTREMVKLPGNLNNV